MFGLEILDIGVGLVFVYLMLALVCTAVNELIASTLNLRGKKLLAGIENLFRAGTALPAPPDRTRTVAAADIYAHPLIQSLFERRWPSYMPAGHFALAVMDTLLPADSEVPRTVGNIKAEVERLGNESLRRTLLLLIAKSGDSVDGLQTNIEAWFNQAMERVSGWYKRQAQWITLAVALLLTVATNVDTIGFADRLSTDATLRAALVEQAKVFANQQPASTPSNGSAAAGVADTNLETAVARVGARIQDLERLGLPIGWKAGDFPRAVTPIKVLGLLLTVFAVSLGAPFWFDVLNRFMQLRGSGSMPEAREADPGTRLSGLKHAA